MIILGNNIKNRSYVEPKTVEVTTAQRNYTYAPGIATYGIKGLDGKTGKPGSSVFFSNKSMDVPEGCKNIVSRICALKVLFDYSDYVYSRPYQNEDTIIDMNGKAYLITDINELIIKNRNNTVTDLLSISNCLEYIGQLPVDTSIFNENNIRTKSAVISNTTEGVSTDNNSLLTLYSTIDNNVAKFIDLDAVYNGIPNINFSVFYNENTKAYHIKSDYPIYFDAPVSVRYNKTNIEITDEYSPIKSVELSNDSITTYVSICKDISTKIEAEVYRYIKNEILMYGCIYTITLSGDLTSKFPNVADITLHYQNGSYNDFLKLISGINSYRFVQQYDYVKPSEVYDKVKGYDLNNIQISLINNLEVFLSVSERSIPDQIIIK